MIVTGGAFRQIYLTKRRVPDTGTRPQKQPLQVRSKNNGPACPNRHNDNG
jgi:hypothetical protein